MFVLKHTKPPVNSVLKMLVDLFSAPETTLLFYTNDIKVLIDILVRQLSDLSAGDVVSLVSPMKALFLTFPLLEAPQMVSRIVSPHPAQHRLRRPSASSPRLDEDLHSNLLRRDGRKCRRPANRARDLQRVSAHLQGLNWDRTTLVFTRNDFYDT